MDTMADLWISQLRKAKKTTMVQDGLKKLHFTFDDGREMVEEWDVKKDTLTTRKFRKPSTLGGTSTWEYEVGEEPRAMPQNAEGDSIGIFVSAANPVCVRCDTKKEFQWRIRNLPYDLDVYSITVTNDGKNAILRTSNKKYYKKLGIPDLERIGVSIVQAGFTMAHTNNTLIITYPKPPPYLEVERRLKSMRDELKANKDGDVDCQTQ